MTVRACSSYTTRGGQQARIQEVMKHPAWSVRDLPDYDVALGLLDKKIRFSDSCHGVDIPNRAMFPPFSDAWVAGWGSIRPDGIMDGSVDSISLQVYYAHVMPLEACAKITQRFGAPMSENFLCLEQKGHRGPCTGDTGSPAVSDGVLWGLASWGIRKKCGNERYPAVFTNVGSFGNLFFITNATHLLMSDPRVYPYLDRLRGNDMNYIEKTVKQTPKPKQTKKGPEVVLIPARRKGKELAAKGSAE